MHIILRDIKAQILALSRLYSLGHTYTIDVHIVSRVLITLLMLVAVRARAQYI